MIRDVLTTMTLRWLPKTITALIIFIIASLSHSSDPFSSNGDDEFLSVEDAYQAVLSIDNNKIYVDWLAAPGYYLYQHQFKAEAKNFDTQEKLSLSFQQGEEKYDEYFQKTVTVYYNNTQTSAEIPKISPPFELVVRSQACADAGLCYPPRKHFFHVDKNLNIIEKEKTSFAPVSASSNSGTGGSNTGNQNQSVSTGNASEGHFLPFILISALIGGLILNLMPCVFPVLSLKALSFASSNMSGHNQKLHGWAYTAGVIGSFVLVALIILGARQAGEALGWGFQLQHPVFVAFMAYLFFIMGLSLSGMLEIGTSWMGAGQSLTSGKGLSSSFFTGVLAAVVASPCTAPFMASALGFALTQPMAIALLVFIALGFGMALPFLLLSYIPSFAKILPAPGAWMDKLKQFLAYPLFATSVWLVWVLGNQVSSDGAAAIVLGAVLIAFGVWLLKLNPQKKLSQFMSRGLIAASFGSAAVLALDVKTFQPSTDEQWQAYSPNILEELRRQGTPVFVDLTADWCITCKVNERVAINTNAVTQKAEQLGITMLQGDWTNSDPDISALLKQHGRSGVPLYLMYPADNTLPPEVLPQILTQKMVLDAMDRAINKTATL